MQTYTLIGRLGVFVLFILCRMVTGLLIQALGWLRMGFPPPCTTSLDIAVEVQGVQGPKADRHGPLGATNLADGAHGSHVALISRAEFRWGQQPCWVQAVQTPIDGNLTHRPQVAVTPDLQLGRMLCGNPAAREGRREDKEEGQKRRKSKLGRRETNRDRGRKGAGEKRGRDQVIITQWEKVFSKYLAVSMNPKIWINPQLLQETPLSNQQAQYYWETLAVA